jgi:hypothetical protein
MELSTEIIKDFWGWLFKPENAKKYKLESRIKHGTLNGIRISILAHSFAQRYGLYEDFFDDHQINITVGPIFSVTSNSPYEFRVHIEGGLNSVGSAPTRDDARLSALRRAEELYIDNFK